MKDRCYTPPVKHLILLAYILLGSTGLAGIASLLFLNLRLKGGLQGIPPKGNLPDSRLVLRFALLFALLFLGLVCTTLWFYSLQILPETAEWGASRAFRNGVGIAGGLIMAAVYGAVFLLLSGMSCRSRGKDRLRNLVRILAALTFLTVLFSTLLNLWSLVGIPPADPGFMGFLGYPLTTVTVLLLGWYCLTYPYERRHPAVRFLGRATGVAALTYLPLTVGEFLLERSGVQPYHPLSLDFLFYLELNLAAVAAFVRSLSPGTAVQPSRGEVSGETAALLGLTAREREMVRLIARGLANKEIGAELGISPATVRTHIYNLFQKAGARSRIELLNLLSAREEGN